VRIWDRGTYECEKWEEAKVIVSFHGERLSGRYALFRTRGERDWMIHRMDPPAEPRDPFPESVVPILARLSKLPAKKTGWASEVKWDGVRAIAYCRPGRLELLEELELDGPAGRRPPTQPGHRPSCSRRARSGVSRASSSSSSTATTRRGSGPAPG
jgi:hypothetical protein